jgi:hypothetical protein
MTTEDVGPVAVNASRDGLEARVPEVVGAIREMATVADVVDALLQR